MAQTFRKSKIENYVSKLRIRKSVLKNQLKQDEFKNSKDLILGEIKSTQLILEELRAEFNITNPDGQPDDKPQCPKCKGEESYYSVEKYNNRWKCHECHSEWD